MSNLRLGWIAKLIGRSRGGKTRRPLSSPPRLLPDGRFSEKALVLDSTHHLSCPFVIEHDGSYRFIPEHAQSRDLSPYVIDDDAKAFSKTTIGAGLPLIDSTIFQWQGRYGMFATHESDAVNSDLYIYHAPDPADPWTGHRQNPVKRDRGNARPHGQIILHEGRPFRPAQDCISHYGSGIVVNAILTLTETGFEERPVSEIRPDRRYDYGLHTVASAGEMTMIDGARLEIAVRIIGERRRPRRVQGLSKLVTVIS